MRSTYIKSIEITPLNFPLDEPFTIASGRKEQIENVFLKVTLESGIEGYGEASPLEPINGENQATVIATLETLKGFLLGKNVIDYERISHEIKAIFWAQCAARCAVEMAILDALTRSRGESLWEFFGKAETTLETDYTISIVDPPTAARKAKELWERGFRKIKVKVGQNLQEDIKRLQAIQDAVPQCDLMLDANEGFSPKEAVQFVKRLKKEGIRPILLEQPVPRYDLKGLRAVREGIDVPVAADESVFFIHDALRVIELKAVDVINIKLMKSGLLEGQQIASICVENDIDLMMGCMLESRLGMAAAVHFAAGLGGFRYVDLDPHVSPEMEPFRGGPRLEGAIYKLDERISGLGVDLQ